MALALPSRDPSPLGPGLYATDAFHRQPLFVVEHQVVRSWEEAHALHGSARVEDVNPAYVAALITGDHSASAAPYRRIRRLPRAHHVRVANDGSLHTSPFDPFAGGAGPMAEEELHAFLRQGLLDHVDAALAGQSGPIGCEHSSGLDSNAVLGALRQGIGVAAEQIHTWSNENSGEREPLQQFRPFHQLLSENCISSDILEEEGRPDATTVHQQQLDVFGAPAQIGGLPWPLKLLQQRGCTVLFSGFGGDQAISHNASNVPTDLVAQGRWRELVQWCGGKRRLLKNVVGRSLMLRHRGLAEHLVLRRTRDFCRSDLLIDALTEEGRSWLQPYLNRSYPWEIDGYLRQHDSIRRRVLADWVAVRAEEETRLAAAHGISKFFPLLDERSIGTLLHQDPLVFGEGSGRGRLVHRRAFAPFLPPVLRDNPTKDRLTEADIEQWREQLAEARKRELMKILEPLPSWHPQLHRYWRLDVITRSILNTAEASKPALKDVLGATRALESLQSINHWFRALEG
jgi:asparagine synthetase B (glutamine-hydrolysing)